MNEKTNLTRAAKILLLQILRQGYFTAEQRAEIEALFSVKSTLFRMVYTTESLYIQSLQRLTDKLEQYQIDPQKIVLPTDYDSIDELAQNSPKVKAIFDEMKDEITA